MARGVRITTLIVHTANDPNIYFFTLSDDERVRAVNHGANSEQYEIIHVP